MLGSLLGPLIYLVFRVLTNADANECGFTILKKGLCDDSTQCAKDCGPHNHVCEYGPDCTVHESAVHRTVLT